MDRRAAMGAIGAAALVGVPAIASADGATSAATRQRAKFIYGNRIAALKGAVDKGDFAAVADEKAAFVLFNSGVYTGDSASKSAAISGTNSIFAAIKAKDAAALKSAYGSYVSANGISEAKAISNSDGQGFSGDYDYRVRTNQAYVFVPS